MWTKTMFNVLQRIHHIFNKYVVYFSIDTYSMYVDYERGLDKVVDKYVG